MSYILTSRMTEIGPIAACHERLLQSFGKINSWGFTRAGNAGMTAVGTDNIGQWHHNPTSNEGKLMLHIAKGLALGLFILTLPTHAAEGPMPSGHYLFAWAGDVSHMGNDFLAVIDADPGSAPYGSLIATAVTASHQER